MKTLIRFNYIEISLRLAEQIGLNEALFITIIEKCLDKYSIVSKGDNWVNVSRMRYFPFWSQPTYSRAVNSLKKQGLVKSKSLHKSEFDHTAWYAIIYPAYHAVCDAIDLANKDKESEL
jgi:hypothetical protein